MGKQTKQAKQMGDEELYARLEEQILWYRGSWTTAVAKLRDCERENERLRAELAQARDRDDGR